MADIEINISPGTAKKLLTAGKWCNDDIVISASAGKSSGSVTIVKADPNAFTFELDPDASKRLLTAGKYCERNILVTAKDFPPALVTLDIADGPIVITDTGYTVGAGEEQQWGENSDHALTITQTDPQTPSNNNIQVTSGTAEITLKGVNLTNSTQCPLAVNGNGTTATVILEGKNTLVSTAGSRAAFEIGLNSTVTIQVPDGKPNAYGSLTADGGDNSAGIGGNHRGNAGKLHIRSGTIIAYGNGYYSTGIGTGRSNGNNYMQEIVISGGHITNTGTTHFLGGGQGATTSISISGGYIVANGVGKVNADKASTQTLSISGGTIVASSTPGLTAESISITGGNIGDSYTGDIPGRTRTKLSFVTAGGSPIADTEIFVAEGDNEWNALTDEDGVVYTYLAADTTVIQAGLTYEGKVEVPISNGEGIFTQ